MATKNDRLVPDPASLTSAEIAFVGQCWPQLLARHALGLLYMASGYSWEGCESFLLVKWEDLGEVMQRDLAASWYLMARLLVRR